VIYYPRCVVALEVVFDKDVPKRNYTFLATPRSVEWKRNAPRKADQAKIVLNYRDFPLDPRLLSAVHVQVYAVDAKHPTTQVALTTQNLRFQGYVDVPESTLSDSDSEVQLECSDYTRLYLNRSWRRVADELPVGKSNRKSEIRIPRGQTLEQFVEAVRAKVRPPGDDGSGLPPTVFETPDVGRLSVSKRAAKNNLAMRDADTAWDVLTMVCEWFAQIPSWDIDPEQGPVLRIRPASSFSSVRAHIPYGSRVKRLQFRRNLQAPERKAIRLLAWNPRTAEVVEGLWPRLGLAQGETVKKSGSSNADPDQIRPEGAAAVPVIDENAKQRSKATSDLKRVQHVLEGDYTEKDLTDMAQLMYEEQAQGRVKGNLETIHMDGEFDTNLLDMSNGDRLVVRLGPEFVAGPYHQSTSEAAAWLSNPHKPNALPREVAEVLMSAHAQVADLDVEFFVLDANHTWDSEIGYRLEIQFTDFLLDQVTRAKGEA